MAFAESVKDRAFARSNGRCECRNTAHGHGSRCTHTVTRYNAAFRQVLTVRSDSDGSLVGCEVLCQTCFLKEEPVVHPPRGGSEAQADEGCL